MNQQGARRIRHTYIRAAFAAILPGEDLIAYLDMLEELLAQLAAEEKRRIQILEVRGLVPDHPVAATCLESNYLKCLICRVV